LGADRAQIGRLLLLQGLTPAVAGLIAGLVIVALAGGVLQSLLYATNGLDRATFAYSSALMLLAAAGACAVPARRAGRGDPAGVLRGEQGRYRRHAEETVSTDSAVAHHPSCLEPLRIRVTPACRITDSEN
jgi:predicted lysophospholipase L1 biosynthesis ABC-type transport system permease subunit